MIGQTITFLIYCIGLFQREKDCLMNSGRVAERVDIEFIRSGLFTVE